MHTHDDNQVGWKKMLDNSKPIGSDGLHACFNNFVVKNLELVMTKACQFLTFQKENPLTSSNCSEYSPITHVFKSNM